MSIADGDWLCPFLSGIAFHWVRAVTGGVDVDIRANETIITNGDTGFIEHGKVEIVEESLSFSLSLKAAVR